MSDTSDNVVGSVAAQPLVSVIIATRNRPGELRAALDGLKTQKYANIEVIVVDQSATPAPLGPDYTFAVRFTAEPRGAAAARNLGLKHARGEVIVCVDDDVIIDRGTFIAEHVTAYADPAVGAVCGRCIEPSNQSARERLPRIIQVLALTIGGVYRQTDGYATNLKGANMSFRRDLLAAVGGFDERFGAPCMYEESDVAWKVRRLGFKIAYRAGAVLTHLGVPGGGQRTHKKNDCRYLAYRDRVLLFMNNMPRYVLPVFLLGNFILALRPLLRLDFASTSMGLSGLAMGVHRYIWRSKRSQLRFSGQNAPIDRKPGE